MNRKSNITLFVIAICFSFSFALAGCVDPLEKFKSDKVLSDEWDAAFDMIYTSFDGMVGENFKIEITAEKEVSYSEYREYSDCELTAISCGDIEYLKEKRVDRKTLTNGDVEYESEIVSEKYLERTQGGTFEYVFENGKWIKKKSDAAYGSIVFERVSSYNKDYFELFTQSLPDYSKGKGGYYDWSVWSPDINKSISCLCKMKEKKVSSISADIKSGGALCTYDGKENVLFLYDYGKQEITLPQI